MILELRNTTPFIDFGFGITAHTVKTGEQATIWLSTLYNQDMFAMGLVAPGGSVTVLSDYEYGIAYSQPGIYSISLSVSHKKHKTSLQSNTLTLTVI